MRGFVVDPLPDAGIGVMMHVLDRLSVDKLPGIAPNPVDVVIFTRESGCKARMNTPRRLFAILRRPLPGGSRRLVSLGLAVHFLGHGLVAASAAPPYLDENGYYWSSTEQENAAPVMWDRADLRFYTDGFWRWTLTVDGQTLEKIAGGEFYDSARNPGINQLAEAVARMRAANAATEAALEQTLRQTARPADAEASQRFENLVARLRRGEKGDALKKALAEFVDGAQAESLLAARDRARQTAFDEVEGVYQRLRLNLAMASAKPVQTMVVSERALVVPSDRIGSPLETDDGPQGYSEALGFPYRLVPVGQGMFYAVVQNKPNPGSAGDSLQLLLGDAVTAINDRPIRSAADLERTTSPQTIVTVAKQLNGNPVRQLVDFVSQGAPQPNQVVPPGYQPLPPGYRYVR